MRSAFAGTLALLAVLVVPSLGDLAAFPANYLTVLEGGTQGYKGYGIFRFNNQTNVLSWTIYHELPVIAGTYQCASAGLYQFVFNSPRLTAIKGYSTTSACTPPITDQMTLNVQQISWLYNGMLYFSLDTASVQDYIRGNITFTGTNAPKGNNYDFQWAAQMDNAQAGTSPVTPDGGVLLVAQANGGGGSQALTISILHNVPSCTAIYLNRAPFGMSNSTYQLASLCGTGKTIANCDFVSQYNTGFSFTSSATITDVDPINPQHSISEHLNNGDVYVNIISSANPNGEARGQVYSTAYLPGANSAAKVGVSLLALLLPALALLF